MIGSRCRDTFPSHSRASNGPVLPATCKPNLPDRSSLRKGRRRSFFVCPASAGLAPVARGSWLQMAAKGYDSRYESSMNRGYESRGRFVLTERHKASMAKKACNHVGLLQAAAPLHLEQARAMRSYEAERVNPRKVSKGLVSGQTLNHVAAGAKCPPQSFQAFLVIFRPVPGRQYTYQSQARKSTP